MDNENVASVSMYDIAKNCVKQEAPLDPLEYNKKLNEIAEDMLSRNYSMLLCRERNDYTIFRTKNTDKTRVSKNLNLTLVNRGNVIFADKQKDGAWEIWIRDFATEQNYAYYLFDYTSGVVDCKED